MVLRGMSYQMLYLTLQVDSAMDVMFLFKAPRGLLRHYSFCALWKGASAGANLPIFSHCLFTVFPLNPVHVLSLHLHAAMEGAVWMWRRSCLLCVKSKYVFFPISTHFTSRNAILLFHILFHFPPDPAKIDLGFFSHLFPSSDTVIFPCPRIYIIDLVCLLHSGKCFYSYSNWIGLDLLANLRTGKLLSVSCCLCGTVKGKIQLQCFWRGIFIRATWCSEDLVLLSDFLAPRQIKLLTVVSVP